MQTLITPFKMMSFQRQLQITFAGGILLLALISSTVASWQGQQRVKNDLMEQGHHLAESLAGQSGLALMYASSENVDDAVDITMSFPDVAGVEIRLPDGALILRRGDVDFTVPQPDREQGEPNKAYLLAETKQSWHFMVRVFTQVQEKNPFVETREPEFLGFVQVMISKQALRQVTLDIFVSNVLSSLFFAGVFLLLIRVLTRNMTRPLEQLAQVMGQAQRGDTEVRAELSGPVDISNMANAFNSMMAELREREIALRVAATAFETEEGVIVTDATPQIIKVNKAFSRITGFAEDEVMGQRPSVLKSRRQSDEFYREMWQHLKKEHAWQGEIWNRYKNGEVHPQWLSITAVVDNQGEVTNYVGTYIDITDRKRTEQALKDSAAQISLSEARLKEAQNIARMGNWELNIQSGRLDYSDEIVNLLGVTRKVLGNSYDTLMEMVHPDDRSEVYAAHQTLLKDHKPVSLTHRIVRPDGEVRWMQQRCKTDLISETGHPLFINAVMQDITTQKEAEIELTKAKQSAEAASRTKSEFLANMSHEIRTPMNAVLGLTQLVLESGLPPRQDEFLRKAHASARALLGILNDILDYSKIEAGHMTVEKIPFNLEETLVHVVNLFDTSIEEKGLELFLEIGPDLPLNVLGDPLRLSQVLNNLVSNAIKFTNEGEIYLKAELLSRQDHELLLRFAVKDTGIGMSKAQMDNLFQSFTQADTSTTRKYGGTGLGLSISQRLVELMGGEITASGVVDEGTTFAFTVKVEEDQAQPHESVSPRSLAGKRILVVDDQDTCLDILRSQLENWGAEVTTVDRGDQALQQLVTAHQSGNPFDLLLLDWRMPGMDGLSVMKRLNEYCEQGILTAPSGVVMVTAHDRQTLLNQTEDLPLNGVLTKPVIPTQLLHILRNEKPVRQLQAHPQQVLSQQQDTLHHIRVLLAEDNKTNRMMATEFLKRRGAEVEIAENGEVAVEKAKAGHFDLILMDLHMPVMDGLEAARQIRQIPRDETTPIIALTAAVMQEDVERCMAVGMVDFISKPIDPDKIMQTLLKWVRPSAAESMKYAEPVTENVHYQVPDDVTLPDNIDGMDLPRALNRLDGNAHLLLELLSGFFEDNQHALEQVETFLADGQPQEAVQLLHTIKGAASNLGLDAISEQVAAWEQGLKHGDSTQPETLATVWRQGQREIEKLLVTAEQEAGQELDPGIVLQLLEKLLPYLEQQELVPNDLMGMLEQFARVDSGNPHLSDIVRALHEFDHAAALASAKELKDRLS